MECRDPRARSESRPAAVETDRRYLLEQIDDAAVVQLYADGFEKLTVKEKKYRLIAVVWLGVELTPSLFVRGAGVPPAVARQPGVNRESPPCPISYRFDLDNAAEATEGHDAPDDRRRASPCGDSPARYYFSLPLWDSSLISSRRPRVASAGGAARTAGPLPS